ELALACHFRIANQGARLGLPEVTLGLVPGGGGTQRLPRLIGAQDAVRMITSGKPVGAKQALSLGLIDDVFDGDREQAAIAFALKQVASAQALPVIADKQLPAAELPDFDALRNAVNSKARNALAQRTAISCVEAAAQLPFEQGLDKERSLFDELVAGTESKAL